MKLSGILCLCLLTAFGYTTGVSIHEIKEYQEMWQALGAEDYHYTFQANCRCIQTNMTPARVVVRDGEISALEDISTGQPLLNISTGQPVDVEYFYTIDEIFELLRDTRSVGVREVNFDEVLSYPTHLFIDYNRMVYDDEIDFTLTDLELD